jgi:hypothetical protein
MQVILKHGSQNWLLLWRPANGKTFYPINYANVAFVGAVEQIRDKINRLLQGKTSQAEFEAYYCRTSKTLALWS